MNTPDFVKEAEVIQFNMDKHHERQANEYCERVTSEMHSLETFKAFLWDIDPDAPEVQAFHGCLDDKDENTKAYAFDIFMNLYEEYVTMVVEL